MIRGLQQDAKTTKKLQNTEYILTSVELQNTEYILTSVELQNRVHTN
jgi:hypothetical protein